MTLAIKKVYYFMMNQKTIELKAYKIEAEQQANALSMSLLGLPMGARLTDGESSIFVINASTAVDLEGWNLSKLIMWVSSSTPLPNFLKLIVQMPRSAESNDLEIHKKYVQISELTAEASPALWISGLPLGAQLTDGEQLIISEGQTGRYNLLNWNLSLLQLQPTKGEYAEFTLRIEPFELDPYLLRSLGELKISLSSNNPYLENNFKYPVTVQQPMEMSLASLQQESNTAITFSATYAEVHDQTERQLLDDQELSLLEEKLRKLLH